MINRKIEYFITLAECLSFTQAAAIHNVSQTAISQYIANLEERLDVRLFERKRHYVRLTEAGRYYYTKVTEMLRDYDETLVRLKTIDAGFHGYLKVGIGVYEFCSTENFFSSFLTLHPEIKVDILQYPYSELSEKLRTRELDMIIGLEFCLEDFSKTEISSRKLFDSSNYLVAHADLLSHYDQPDAADILRNECLITNCEDYGPSSLQMLYNLLNDAVGFVPSQIEQTNSLNTQLMMVRAKHGVAIVPGFVVDEQGTDLVKIPLPNSEKINYHLIRLIKNDNPSADLMYNFEVPS